MKQISKNDAIFFFADTPRTPAVIGGISLYDQSTAKNKTVRFKEILNWIDERIALWPASKQRLVRVPFDMGLPYLVDDPEFNIESHVHHLALPKPGDWRQLCILASRLYSRPLDMNRPLWETYIVEGLDSVEGIPKGSFAVIGKMHHIIADGKTAMALMMAMHSEDPELARELFEKVEENDRDTEIPSDLSLIAKTLPEMMRQPLNSIRSVTSLMKGEYKARRAQSTKKMAGTPTVPKTIFNKTLSPYRTFDGCRFPVADFKAVKSKVEGATFNDVTICLCAGAMRKYLIKHNELPNESLVAMCPISVRKEGDSAGGNQISNMQVAIGTHIGDPIKRLNYIHQRTTEGKELAALRGDDSMGNIAGILPPATASLFFKSAEGMKWISKVKPLFNTFISNVPGIPMDIFYCGAKMVGNYGIAPLVDGVGSFHTVTSFKDHMYLSVTGDRDILPDPASYIDCLKESFAEMLSA